jgi:Bacterial Ig-like domain/Bacterial pre-peptidase C-terminal domain/SdrD B-like domain/Bacterial Ig domain/LVIVD repeat
MLLQRWLRSVFPRRSGRGFRQHLSRGAVRYVACERLEELVMLSSVSGAVFQDTNANGRIDTGERPIEDMPVSLWNLGADQRFRTEDDIFVTSSLSDAAGEYSFSLDANAQFVVQFGTQFGAYRFSPTDSDAAILTSSSISSDSVSSTITGGPLGVEARVDAGVDSNVPADILLRRLQNAYSFRTEDPNYLSNVYGQQEKWLRGDSQYGTDWYVLTSDGDLRRWNAASGSINGEFIAVVGDSVYQDPLLLLDAPAVPDLSAAETAELAWELDSQLSLDAAGTWYEGYGGLNVKWIQGNRHPLGNVWYFIRSDGELIAWDGEVGQATGTSVAQLTTDYYDDPVLLTNAIRPVPTGNQAGLARESFEIVRSVAVPDNVADPEAAWFEGAPNQFGNNNYFVRTDGQLLAWDGTDSESGRLLTTLTPDIHSSPDRLVNADFYLDTTESPAAAYDLDRLYRLTPRPWYFTNWSGQNEKWIEARRADGMEEWFLVFPDGEVARVQSWNHADRTVETIPLLQLTPEFYQFPHLLHNALKPLVDVVSPTIALDNPAAIRVANTNTTFAGQVRDNRPDDVTLSYQINAGPITPLTLDVDGRFSLTTELAVDGTADGSHPVRFRAVDSAGNVSSVKTVSFVLDTVAVPPTLDLSIASDSGDVGDQITNAARVTLTGIAEPNSVLVLDTLARTTLSTASGVFQFTNIPLAVGDNPFLVTMTDRAGNQADANVVIQRTNQQQTLDPVLRWNLAAREAIRRTATSPPIASRGLAMLHLAMLDVVNAFEGTPAFYVALQPPPGASLEAAVSGAAHQVLQYLFPNQAVALSAVLSEQLGDIPDGQSKDDGLALGRQVGDATIAIRATDGWDGFGEHYSGSEPGVWQATPPMYAVPLLPKWGDVAQFVIAGPDSYVPDRPPALDSEEYATAVNEVQELGKSDSETRTAEQTAIARFWSDGLGTYTPPGHWNQIAEIVGQEQRNSLSTNAKLFAQLNTAMADAAIVAWNVKYETNFWRPLSAIQLADSDGNDSTIADEDWTPLIVNPPFPEYVSGHSAFSGAAAAVLNESFGDDTAFTLGSFTAQNLVRSFDSFDAAANEAALSRVYGGIHYSFSSEDGLTMGREIGASVLAAFSSSQDMQAPSILFDQPSATSTDNFNIQGRVLDNLLGAQEVTVQLNDGVTIPLQLQANGRFDLPTGLLTDGSDDGTHAYRFTATDAAGNIAVREFTFTLDTQSPELTITSPANDDDLSDASPLIGTIDQTGSPIVSLSYAFDGGLIIPFSHAEDRSFNNDLDISRLAVGPHNLSVTATDAAGNTTQITLSVNLPELAEFNVTSFTPTAGSEDVGVTFRPQVFFSRSVNISTLSGDNLYATDSFGDVIPATIAPAGDGTFAWMFFTNPIPGGSTITVHVDGSTILAAVDGVALDADGDGDAGGELSWTFSTVSVTGVTGTHLAGTVADPGADLRPGTFDDIRAGQDGLLMTADDVYLNPIADVKVFIFGMEDQAVFTDADGNFELRDIPAGHIKLAVDGQTASNAPADVYFPEMVMDLNIRPSEVNTVMATMDPNPVRQQAMLERGVYLPRLQTSLLSPVSPTEPTTVGVNALTAPDLSPEDAEYLTLTVQPGSILGFDGLPIPIPKIGVSTVPPEMVQGMLPAGFRDQHTFEITIQAPGASVFTTPVAITFPNFQNAAPGTQVNIYSFDHTTGLVVPDGTGTVSADGQSVRSDPSSGIRAPGWHFVQVGTRTTGAPCLGGDCFVLPPVTPQGPRGFHIGGPIQIVFSNSLLPEIRPGVHARAVDWYFTPTAGLFFDESGQRIPAAGVRLVNNRDDPNEQPKKIYFLADIKTPSTSDTDTGLAVGGKGTFSAILVNPDTLKRDARSTDGKLLVRVDASLGWGNRLSVPLSLSSAPTELAIAQVQQRLRYLGFRAGTKNDLLPMIGIFGPLTRHAIQTFNAAVTDTLNGTNLNQVPDDSLNYYINASNAPRWVKLPSGPGTTWKNDDGEDQDWGTHWAADLVERAAVIQSSGNPILTNDLSEVVGGPTDHASHQAGMDIDVRLVNIKGPGIWYDINDKLDDGSGVNNGVSTVSNLNPPSLFWDSVSAFSNGQLTRAAARSIVVGGPTRVFTSTYSGNNGWELDQTITRLYAHRDTSSPYDLAIQSWQTGSRQPGESDGALFDRGFDRLMRTRKDYNRTATVKQIQAFATTTSNGVSAKRAIFNDPHARRLLDGAAFAHGVVQLPGHANHFHIDVQKAPPRFPYSSFQGTFDSMFSTALGYGRDTSLYYRFRTSRGFAASGRIGDAESINVILTPNVNYEAFFYQASTNRSGIVTGRTNRSGGVTQLGDIFLDQQGGKDADGDGLPDLGEIAIGTSPATADTDKDGISDAAEIEQGLDPLDDRGFPTGIIGSLSLAGEAHEVIVEGTTAYVATGTSGLAIVDVSRFNKPILLSQIDLPGVATDVAASLELGLVAVATGDGGLQIIDVTAPTQPLVRHTIPITANRIDMIDGVVYVASDDKLYSVDVVTGTILQRLVLHIGGIGRSTLTDVVHERSMLYIMNSSMNSFDQLQAIDVTSGMMVRRDSLMMRGRNGRLFVGNGIVYIMDTDKERGGYATADVTNPDALVAISGNTAPSGTAPSFGLAANGSGIGLLIGQAARGPGSVRILDVSDTANTYNRLLEIELEDRPTGISIASGIAFVTDSAGRLHVINYLPFDIGQQPPTATLSVADAVDVDPNEPGIQVLEGSRIYVNAKVSDDVQVAKVELLVNGQVVRTDVSFPWDFPAQMPLFSEETPNVVLQVRATDTGGNVTISDPNALVLTEDHNPPSLDSLTPLDGAAVPEGSVQFSMRFSEPIAPDSLQDDAIQLVNDEGTATAPATLNFLSDNQWVRAIFTGMPADDYRLLIHAAGITDRAGNALGTADIETRLTVTHRETLTTTALDADPNIDGFQVYEGATMGFHVETEPGVLVEKVELLLNGVVVDKQQRSPFNLKAIPPNITGDVDTFNIQARVTDRDGFTSISLPLEFLLLQDTTPPEVTGITPDDGTTVLHPIRSLQVDFSEPMRRSSISLQTILLVHAGLNDTFGDVDDRQLPLRSLRLSDDDRVLQITTEYLSNGRYQLRIARELVLDRAGNAIGVGSLLNEFRIDGVLTVTTTADSGPGSLREAITLANRTALNTEIVFSVPTTDPNYVDIDQSLSGGDTEPDVFVISPQSPLPPLANPFFAITINGRSQTAFGGDTSVFGPEIVIDGAAAGADSDGLQVVSDGHRVLGLNISGFKGAGVVITGDQNALEGNYIGSDATGLSAAPNQKEGVLISGGANNRIGAPGSDSPSPDDMNLIAHNQGGGVFVVGSTATGNSIRGNLIYSNAGADGIDLGGDGSTANDTNDVDNGPNGLQNKPEILLSVFGKSGGEDHVRVAGRLNSMPDATYTIDFYSTISNSRDPRRWLGAVSVTTDSTGFVEFTPLLQVSMTPDDELVTATATDVSGNTSELSTPQRVYRPPTSEPNSTLSTAADTGLNHSQPGLYQNFSTIGNETAFQEPGLDVDIFTVQMNAGDVLTIDIDQRDVSFDSLLRLFDSAGTELFVSDNDSAPGESPGIDPYLRYVAPATGIYYAAISARSNDAYDPINGSGGVAGRFGRVNLEVMMFPPGSDEPNDVVSQAISTNRTSALPGVYKVDRYIGDNPAAYPHDDRDLYEFQVDSGDMVRILVSALSGSAQFVPQLRIVDNFGIQVPNFEFWNGDFTPTSSGLYYVEVTGSGDDAGEYQLWLGYREPNDTFEDATRTGISSENPGVYFTEAAIGDNQTGSGFGGGGDIDLFEFALDAGDRVLADIDVDRSGSEFGVDVLLGLWDENGEQVILGYDEFDDPIYQINEAAAPGEGDPQGDPYLDFVATTTGRYYLNVVYDGFYTPNDLTGPYELTITIPWSSGLMSQASAVRGEHDVVEQSELDSSAAVHPLFEEAIKRWQLSGLNRRQSDHLKGIELRITDLPDGYLGFMSGDVLWIDQSADGYGWYVDATPDDDEEYSSIFTGGDLRAVSGDAYRGVDLLTVLMHELGHSLGLSHNENGASSSTNSNLMSERLSPGTRVLPPIFDNDLLSQL